ncbi:hypothetical protein IC582_020389 [Cucumis melo]
MFSEFLNRDHRQTKSWVVGELIKSKFKEAGCLYKSSDNIEDMRQDYDINMSYEKAWRARENANERVRRSPEESYNLLRRYGEALKLTNLGTIFHMELEDDRSFKYLFMAVGPCVRGFLNCIRPVIVMDGTFLKNKKTQFDMDILGRVDDEEAFKSFDWLTFFYTRLLNSLKTSLQGKKEAYELKKTTSFKVVTYYNIKGYVLAFQV